MKKIFALLTALALTVSLAACGGSKPAQEQGNTDADKPAAEGKKYKVAMIVDSSISDGGWGAACYNAMVAAAKDKGWENAYTDQIAVSDYVSAIESYCQLGYDMIFLPGNQYSDAASQVAKDYPDIAFAVLNGSADLPTENIMSILPDAKQIGYLAGTMAGLMSQSKTLGFIGGMELDTTKDKLQCFEKGAQLIDPSIKALSAYAGGFSDTAKGMELAKTMINQGADVFFGDASAVDSGARQAIDDANGDNIKIYDIGQPADLLGQNPCIISSVVTDNAGMIKLCMQAVEEGKFGNDVIYGTLENGGLSVGAINENLVPKDVQSKYMEFVEKIKSGEIK